MRAIDDATVRIKADVIEAKYIALVDDDGNERAAMYLAGSKRNPTTIMRILGKDGSPRITLQVHGDESNIVLEQPGGAPGLSLGISKRSNGMMIADSEGRPIYQCGIYHDKTYADRDGKPAIILTNFESGDTWQMIVG